MIRASERTEAGIITKLPATEGKASRKRRRDALWQTVNTIVVVSVLNLLFNGWAGWWTVALGLVVAFPVLWGLNLLWDKHVQERLEAWAARKRQESKRTHGY